LIQLQTVPHTKHTWNCHIKLDQEKDKPIKTRQIHQDYNQDKPILVILISSEFLAKNVRQNWGLKMSAADPSQTPQDKLIETLIKPNLLRQINRVAGHAGS
jgi:hypothetical protein